MFLKKINLCNSFSWCDEISAMKFTPAIPLEACNDEDFTFENLVITENINIQTIIGVDVSIAIILQLTYHCVEYLTITILVSLER